MKKREVMNFIASFISTGCFVGKIKYAPGTFGSLFATILCLKYIELSILSQFIILLLILVIGTLSTYIYLLEIKKDLEKDPKEVVIDEIFAIFMISFVMQIIIKTTFGIKHLIIIFLLFRFFDILKPFPISYVDKNIHGAKGIMLDDILAGFASIILLIIFL